jgi:hypothetical protein
MAHEKKAAAETQQFKWVKCEKGIVELYANMIHPTWTLFDVRLVLGQLMGVRGDPAGKGFVIEEQGGVTMSWPQAKALRDTLITLIASYEEANGEIKEIKLAQPKKLIETKSE